MSIDTGPIQVPGWKGIQHSRKRATAHCVATGRYLRFNSAVRRADDGAAVVRVEVMTDTHPLYFDRKLCEMVLSVDDLRAILAGIEADQVLLDSTN